MNAISEDGKCESFGETFNIHENTCYGPRQTRMQQRRERAGHILDIIIEAQFMLAACYD